ncbi:MAG TPA: SDR family oxidoreductase [Bacteroidia bacterium]|jgi:short-subunit dehydrogenase|nr:SDR family oxidoreductase [Bacteroidia bacterium]
MNSLDGRVIWITGASSGIGRALANSLSRKGARLVLSARKMEALEKVKEECGLTETNCLLLPFDLEQTAGIHLLAKAVETRFGRIDVLINNGGVSQRSLAIDTPLELDRKIMELNYFGTIALTKSVLPYMVRQKQGQIVVISSVSGKFGFFLRSAYSASKHALHGFFESLRMELQDQHIGVLLVCPGKIATNISKNALKADGTAFGKMDEAQAKGLSAEACAAEILKAMEAGKEEVYIGQTKERTALLIKRLLPALFSRMIRKQKAE